jgi:hypothetical protein
VEWRYRIAAGCLVAMCLLVLVSVRAAVTAQVAANSRAVSNLQRSATESQTALPGQESVPAGSEAVTLELQSLDVGKRQVAARLVVQLGTHVLDSLYDTRTGDRVYSGSVSAVSGRLSSYQGSTFVVVARDTCGAGLHELAIRSLDLLPPPGVESFASGRGIATFEVPVLGSAELFPDESYFCSAVITVQPPGDVQLRLGGNSGALAPDLFLQAGPLLSGLDATFGTKALDAGRSQIDFVINRSWTSRVFIYCFALAPFVLAIIVWVALVARRDEGDALQGVVGIAAAALTILPLRSVLVPAEVGALTRIDFVLGIELLLFLTAAAAQLVVAIPRGDNAAPK